ncbi:FAD-dependent oxidoreductase [soil metagenome]
MASRRDFIRTIILGSGAIYTVALGACERPRPTLRSAPPPIKTSAQRFRDAHAYLRDRGVAAAVSTTRTCDVVVIGGGLSGLATAHLLRSEGYHVALIENESRIGGSAVSEQIAGIPTSLGSVYFVERSQLLLDLMKTASVTDVVCPTDGYMLNGTLHSNIWRDADIQRFATSEQDRSAMRRFRDDVLAMTDDQLPSYPLPKVLPPAWAAYDAMSGADLVAPYNSQLLYNLLDSYSRSSMGAGIDTTNAYCLLNFYASEFDIADTVERFTFEGGMGGLTRGLAASMHDGVHTNEVVIRVENTATGVRVISVDASGAVVSTSAARAVMATQKFMAPFIIADVPSAQRDAMRAMTYAPYATIHIHSSQPLVEASTIDTWYFPSSPLFSDVINPQAVSQGGNDGFVCSIYAPMPLNARVTLQDDAAFAAHVANVVHAFLANVSETAAQSVGEIYAWAWGHSLVVPIRGSHNGLAQRASAPIGNIHFANTDCDASPAVESAISSAIAAAEGTLHTLKHSNQRLQNSSNQRTHSKVSL